MLMTMKNINSLQKAMLFAFVLLCTFVAIPNTANAQFEIGYSSNQFVSNYVADDPAVTGDLSGTVSTDNILNQMSGGLPVVPAVTVSGKQIPNDIRMAIYKASQETGVSMARIAARIEVETGGSWNTNAKSGAGAMGLMQVMPNTWKAYGSGNPYNAADSIMAGAKVIATTDKLTKNRAESDAAYNLGIGNLNKAKAKHGENWQAHLPKETREYIGKTVNAEKALTTKSAPQATTATSSGTAKSTKSTKEDEANYWAKLATYKEAKKELSKYVPDELHFYGWEDHLASDKVDWTYIRTEIEKIEDKSEKDAAYIALSKYLKTKKDYDEAKQKYSPPKQSMSFSSTATGNTGFGDAVYQMQAASDNEHVKLTNADCRLDDMKQEYQSECYSCKVVKLLIKTFMNACANVYSLSKEAGTKVLFYGFIMWMVLFALKNVSSVTSLEPSNNINDLLIFLFKVLLAYVCINGGLTTFTTYIIDPIMIAGADYGLGIINSISAFIGKAPESPVYTYEGAPIISPKVINKIFEINRAIDYTVSTNLVIGNAIICHGTHAGAWVDTDILGYALRIPNLLLVVAGAAIWFCGFMMTLSVAYYLVDISYKMGFAIIILPIVLGLWPFGLTKDKLFTCISIVLKAAATFAFLAITASYGIILIDHAYGGASDGGIQALFTAVKEENSEWISQRFDITSSYFLILIIAYLYAIKLLPQGATEYVNKFFSDGVFGGASPMHSLTTHATDMAKGVAMKAGKMVKDGAKSGIKGVAKKGINAFKSNDDQEGGTTMVGNATKNAGNAAKNAGKATQKAGDAMNKTGAAINKGGAAASKAGDSIMTAGKGLSSTGLGAVIGVPLMALGAVVKTGGVVAQGAGKATQLAGKATKASGKVMEKTGALAEKAGKATNSVWNKASRAPGKGIKKGWGSIKSKFKK